MTGLEAAAGWRGRGGVLYGRLRPRAGQSRDLKAISEFVTYGWGMIPVHVRIGKTEWKTSLFPKDGRYIVPINVKARKAEKLEEGDKVTVRLEIR